MQITRFPSPTVPRACSLRQGKRFLPCPRAPLRLSRHVGERAPAVCLYASASQPAARSQITTASSRKENILKWQLLPYTVDVELSYVVEDICTLVIRGELHSQKEHDEDVALDHALVACFFNITDERANALRRAVNHVLQHNPGLLDTDVLEDLGLHAPPLLREASSPAAGSAQHGKPQPLRESRSRLGREAMKRSLPGRKNLLEVLGFRHLYKLCTALAPEMAASVDEEMSQVLFRLRQEEQPSLAWAQQGSSNTSPAAVNGSGPGSLLPSGSSSGGADTQSASASAAAEGASAAAVEEGEEKALARWAEALVLQPEWGGWVRRMRHALVLWAREQPLGPEDEKEAQEERDAQAKQQTGSSKPPKRGRGFRGSFIMDARTPDDLRVKHKIAIQVSGEGSAELKAKAEDFYNKVAGLQEFRYTVQSTTSYPKQLQDLLFRVGHPEGAHKDMLHTWALREAQAGTVSSFECIFPEAQQRASGADGDSSGSDGASSGSDSTCAAVPATASQAGGEVAGSGAPAHSTAAAGAPQGATAAAEAAAAAAAVGTPVSRLLLESNVEPGPDNRGFSGTGVDLRHLFLVLGALEAGTLVGEPLKGVWCPHSGPLCFRRSSADGKQRYDLRVYPTRQPHPPLELELSKRQFWALIDCLDAFRKAHPRFAQLLPPQPLEADAQQQRWWPR